MIKMKLPKKEYLKSVLTLDGASNVSKQKKRKRKTIAIILYMHKTHPNNFDVEYGS